ncbi:MAG: pyridoxal-phosphate dependent enzyme, partial [Paraglaciecola sp.]|nr:pyridoxal-phosphate dependent enzyme [Paraglaciecola sp.]
VHELDQDYDYIVAPVASGGTLAGLISGVAEICPSTKVLGVGVLKGQEYLELLVTSLLPKNLHSSTNWHINHDYHCGGYAKSTPELTLLCSDFYRQTNIKIEPVYSGKLFFALRSLIANQYFPSGSRILALHTGGLQGAR